jgi:hypothetical protein
VCPHGELSECDADLKTPEKTKTTLYVMHSLGAEDVA